MWRHPQRSRGCVGVSLDEAVAAFATEVGADDPVTITGLGTRGGPVAGCRTVKAPGGIEWIQPAEMTIRCGAGTSGRRRRCCARRAWPMRCDPRLRNDRWGAGGRPQRCAPPRLGAGARHGAPGQVRLGGRRGGEGRRADGEERQWVRSVPAPGGLPRDPRVPCRRHLAHSSPTDPRAVVFQWSRSVGAAGRALSTDVGALGRSDELGAARRASRRRERTGGRR